MYTIGLSSYTARVRRKRDTKNFQVLSSFDASTDFFTFLTKLLRAKQNQFIELNHKFRRLQVNNDVKLDGRAVDGTVDVGEFGITSTFRDETGADTFRRLRNHSEMYPLYYRAWIPKDEEFGLIILQNYGVHGCKSAFEHLIVEAFSDQYPDFVFELREAVSRSMVDHYIKKGLVKEFKFLSNGVPSDWADGYGGVPLGEDEATLEVRIKAKPGMKLPWPQRLSNYFSGNGLAEARLFELSDFRTNKFKVKLEVDGVPRTLTQSEFFNMTSRMDVTADVEKFKTGHPKIDSLRPIAVELLKDIAKDMKLRK